MKIDVDGIARQFQAKIDMVLRNNSRTELYNDIGALLVGYLKKEQFDSLGKFFNREQWKPLSAGYAAAKKERNREPVADLQDVGTLKSSFNWKVLPDGVQLYNSAEYAPHLHYGTKKMPARPIFPIEIELPAETMAEIEELVKIWLIQQLNR